MKTSVPTNRFRHKCYQLAEGYTLLIVDFLTVGVIILLYSLKTYTMPHSNLLVLELLLYLCTAEMNVAAAIRLLGHGSSYFQSTWNR